jgi:hypothetical protein
MKKSRRSSRISKAIGNYPVIAVANHKGGVGKTEITRHVAYAAIENRQRIVLFDADKQDDSANLLLPKGKVFNRTEYEDFERSEMVLVTKNFQDVRAYRSQRLTVCDCPPQVETFSILSADVDFWVIPVGSDEREVSQALSVVKMINKPFAFVLSRWDIDAPHAPELMLRLFKAGRIYRAILHIDTDIVTSSRVERLPTWDVDEYDDDGIGFLYKDVADWILVGCDDTDDDEGGRYLTADELEEDYEVEFERIRSKERVRYA